MSHTSITKIHAANLALQQLKAAGGPAPLVVLYVQIKKLCGDLLQTNPRDQDLSQLYDLLVEISQNEVSTMIDCYEQDQHQSYQNVFAQIKDRIGEAVKKLPH